MSRTIEYSLKSTEVTWVARSSPQDPVFGSPKKVGVEGGLPTRPTDRGVVVLDQVMRTAGEHRLSHRIWGQRRRLPRLGLTFGHHPSPAALSQRLEQGAPRCCPRTVRIKGPGPQPQECVSWVVVDAHDVGELRSDGQRVTLVAGTPPLR